MSDPSLGGPRRTNVLFHGVGVPRRQLEPGEEAVWISRALLHDVLDIVSGHDLAISVDDGNASDVDEVLPALADRGLTATFFIIAGRLGARGSLSRSAVLELRDAGMRVGSHGMHHRPWRGLSPGDEQEEFVTARLLLAELVGEDIEEAACPFGAYDRLALRSLRSHGYSKVHTSDGWPSHPQDWLQPRLSLHRDDNPSSVKSALFDRPSVRLAAITRAKKLWKRYR